MCTRFSDSPLATLFEFKNEKSYEHVQNLILKPLIIFALSLQLQYLWEFPTYVRLLFIGPSGLFSTIS